MPRRRAADAPWRRCSWLRRPTGDCEAKHEPAAWPSSAPPGRSRPPKPSADYAARYVRFLHAAAYSSPQHRCRLDTVASAASSANHFCRSLTRRPHCSRSGSHNVGSAGQLLVQPQRIRRGVAEQGQVALEVGVRSLVDDDLSADELLAVEDLAEDDVARAQQDGAVGGDEQPG
jgi:hypothetical protein